MRALQGWSTRGPDVALALLALAWLVPAQGLQAQAAPTGPAQVITGAREARERREMQQAAQRGGDPQQGQPASAPSNPHAPATAVDPHAQGAVPNPHAAPSTQATAADTPGGDSAGAPANPHGAGAAAHPGMGAQDQAPQIASERVDPSLPTGTVRVRVVDPAGRPAAGTKVSLGVMEADGNRSSKELQTDASGVASFSALATGERQAYRINAPFQGAKYSSSPLRLPLRGGYDVEIHQLPVTHDARLVVLYLGATSIELKDDRMKIVQQVRLLNLGGATYVFPDEGTLVQFPKGFLAVQTEDVMTDQHVTESKDEGVRIRGSLAPGEVTLLWGFDLPLEGTEAHVTLPIPWLTFAYRVISDAPPGMSLTVDGLPEPIAHSEGGRRMFVTEIQLKVGDPRLTELRIALRGIPGPGAARWVAAALALLLLIGGVVLSKPAAAPSAGDSQRARRDELEARKAELLRHARELQAQRDRDQIGPQYYAEQLELVRDELAALLLATSTPGPEAKA